MFRHPILRAALLAVLPLLLASCGGDPAAPDDLAATGGATLRAEFELGGRPLEVTSARAPDVDGRGFILRGDNIRWDADQSALLVDFTVENDTENTYPEPVVLTFLYLIPDDTTIKNADNGETGPGAQFLFEFDNDDDKWSPGETSLPRTVAFGTQEGTAVGFVARIDVGLEPGNGAIGGIVWHDKDGDGEIDDDEAGLGGVGVLIGEDGTEPRRTVTESDGSYRFDNVPSGFWMVHAVATEGWVPTTPPRLAVVLPEGSTFMHANFGCRREDDGGTPEIRVGDKVHAKGEYRAEPDRLVAGEIEVCRDDDRSFDGNSRTRGSLRGPATGTDLDNGILYLMGTPIAVPHDDDGGDAQLTGGDDCPKPSLEEVEEGDRVRVDPYGRVEFEEDEILKAEGIRCWNGHGDRAKGVVQAVRSNDDGVFGIRVLDTWVQITPDTRIEHCDDDDDDDEDDD